MSSLTAKTERKRLRKARTAGSVRKRALAKGSTPRFPIHLDEDPNASLPQPPGSHPAEKR